MSNAKIAAAIRARQKKLGVKNVPKKPPATGRRHRKDVISQAKVDAGNAVQRNAHLQTRISAYMARRERMGLVREEHAEDVQRSMPQFFGPRNLTAGGQIK